MADRIPIIGIGDDGLEGLTESARRQLEQAEVVVGPEYLLQRLPRGKAQHLATGTQLDQVVERVQGAGERRVVILASGDPLFYGVARYLSAKLGKDRFEVIPHVSSMQLAFARVMESWEEAYLTDLGTRPLAAVVERIRVAEKVGLFTSEQYPPSVVA